MNWSNETILKETFGNLEAAVARPDGDVCLKCASAISRALRGPDPSIDVEMYEELFHAAAAPAQNLILEDPTSERVLNVAATLLQVAAQCWVRYRRPEGAREFLPLDDDRFSRLAGSIFVQAIQSQN